MSDNKQSGKHGGVTLGLVGLFAFAAGTVFSGENATDKPNVSRFTSDTGAAESALVEGWTFKDSEAADEDVYYSNCSEARAAGADPVRYDDPGYASHLDRDGDGVGCE